MTFEWTTDALLALEPKRLDVLRRNAGTRGDAALIERCEQIQASRKPKKTTKSPRTKANPVIGFHYVCEPDHGVVRLAGGRFWSGVWVVDEAHCDAAIKAQGYLALHSSKSEPSHRQGTIVDWKTEGRPIGKTEVGVTFLVEPFEEPMPWFGTGSGEKGYRRAGDEPRWVPKDKRARS